MSWAGQLPAGAPALAVGVAGLVLILGAGGDWPVPRNLGEGLALLSGVLWAVSTTGIRVTSDTQPGETAFVFAAGGTLGALCLTPLLEPVPQVGDVLAMIGWSFLAASLWWGASIAALMWATARLEPARVGILLMAEVLVSALSASLLAGETLGALELAGGALVLLAGLLEVWPDRDSAPRA